MGGSKRPVREATDGVTAVGATTVATVAMVVVRAGIAAERTGDGEETRKESSRGNSSNPPRKRNRSKKIIERSVTFRDV
jgi:hypothetical protein